MTGRRSAYQARSLDASLTVMDQDSAPEQMMRIARLRPLPFSSTTVALASCSSDHFPLRCLYISDVRERRCAPGPRLASSSKGSSAHASLCIPCARPWEVVGTGPAAGLGGLARLAHHSPVQRRRNIGHDTALHGATRHGSTHPAAWVRDVSSGPAPMHRTDDLAASQRG